jgi:hypothetical protein
MAKHEHSVELAGVNLAGRNHVCAFFNTIDEEHRVLGSFYKDGIDRGEKAAHIVDPETRPVPAHSYLIDVAFAREQTAFLTNLRHSSNTTELLKIDKGGNQSRCSLRRLHRLYLRDVRQLVVSRNVSVTEENESGGRGSRLAYG